MRRFNFSILVIAIILLSALVSFAQEEKKSIKLGLSYYQINDQVRELKATAKAKNGKKFEPVAEIEVEFFLGEQSSANSIGKAKTNKKGIASIELPLSAASKLDSVSSFKLTALVAESKTYNEQSTEVEITKARIDLTIFEANDKKEVGAKLLALNDGQWAEVPDVDVKLFVRRNLADLSLSEKTLTTDAGGDVSASLDFKTPIPGDANGNIIIGAKVEDNDNYGTIVTMKYAKWGVAQKINSAFNERSLWASRDKTPIWLLVFPNLIIAVVWGLIFYMLYLIYKIREAGRRELTSLFK